MAKKKGGKSKKAEKKTGVDQFADAGVDLVDTTPAGQLKDFSKPMHDAYYPRLVEAAWDKYWEAQDLYKADEKDKVCVYSISD